MEKVEKVLRDYTEIIQLDYRNRLKEIKMNSEIRRLERYKIIYLWKILENRVPNPGIELINENWADERRGRQASIPKTKNKQRLSSINIMAPKLFNKLPKYIRNLSGCSVDEFKIKLDNLLTQVPDEPKSGGLVPGAMSPDSVSSNSLLNQMDRAWREGFIQLDSTHLEQTGLHS